MLQYYKFGLGKYIKGYRKINLDEVRTSRA
jgi:hypothetical protein